MKGELSIVTLPRSIEPSDVVLGTGLSMSPSGDAVATGTTDTTAQANVFR